MILIASTDPTRSPSTATANVGHSWDFRNMSSNDVAIFLRGWQAARAGQPNDAHMPAEWRDGYNWYVVDVRNARK